MTQNPETNVADVFDRHRRRVMVALLLIGVMTALRAARQLVDDPISDYLGILMLVCVVGAMAIFASVVYWKLFKLPADQRQLYFSYDGFVTNAIERAKNAAFVVTFVTVTVLATLDNTLSEPPFVELPPVFYLSAISAMMMLTMAITFFVLDREGGEPEPEWDASA